MILDEMKNSNIYNTYLMEQHVGGDDPKPGTDPEGQPEPPEFVPLKKHFLVDKLQNLKAKLSLNSIPHEELDNILQFSNEMSYDTLLRLTNDIIDVLNVKLSEVAKNDKSKKAV